MDGKKARFHPQTSVLKERHKYSLSTFAHDVLVFLSYFVNNFLYYCFSHVLTKTLVTGLRCTEHFYNGNFEFVNQCFELLVHCFIVYTWQRKYSGKFDGYAFHHVLHYRYGMINFREMVSRVFGTLSAAVVFGFFYSRSFGSTPSSYNSLLKNTLYKMVESKGVLTMVETFVYPNLSKATRRQMLKRLLSGSMLLPAFKYEDRYFDLVEKYIAFLFECFVVELTFSLFVYTMSSLMLKSRSYVRSNIALSTFVRRAFTSCGNALLSKVDGKITLDESKSVIQYFSERNSTVLLVRLLANLLGAVLIPSLIPMPKVMGYYEFKEIYPNSKLEVRGCESEFWYSYYVDSSSKNVKKAVCSSWPNTKLGRLFYRLESYLNKKLVSRMRRGRASTV